LVKNNALSAMKSINPRTREPAASLTRLAWIFGTGCLLLVLILSLRPRSGQNSAAPAKAVGSDIASTQMAIAPSSRRLGAGRAAHDSRHPKRPAEEVVAEKVSQFAGNRQNLVEAMAKQFGVAVPEEVHRFFAAVQAGRWEETTNLFAALKKLRLSDDRQPGLERLWPAIMETYGVTEQAHQWPAQTLLDYGHAVLDSLRPGMVYVGGSDPGRFIPTLLTDTGEGEPHIVLTQNALADATYLDYLRFQYGDRMASLTGEDGQSSFQTYLADAQKRLQHDQQFPAEPKQIRPGENIQVTEGRVQVSGPVAVMAINEQLLRTLLEKNPNLSFALEESSPLKSFYADATTLGPITELRATTGESSPLTAERATQAVDFWRSTLQQLLADPAAADAADVRLAYGKLVSAQANLFADRQFPAVAEQAYRLASEIAPASPEAISGYANLLIAQHRFDEARQLLQTAVSGSPDNQQFRSVLRSVSKMK